MFAHQMAPVQEGNSAHVRCRPSLRNSRSCCFDISLSDELRWLRTMMVFQNQREKERKRKRERKREKVRESERERERVRESERVRKRKRERKREKERKRERDRQMRLNHNNMLTN